MKKLLVIVFMLVAYNLFSQDIYTEFYKSDTEEVFITDSYKMLMYDNVYGLENIDDKDAVRNTGFQIQLVYVCYNDSLRSLYKNAFAVGDEGILRIKIWDTKLYGYCRVIELTSITDDVCLITVEGIKNMPSRKKLLFKDSPTIRMWNYPWLGPK